MKNLFPPAPHFISCRDCNDAGVVAVSYHDNGGSTLMRCTCEHSKIVSEKLVQWDNKLGGVFKKTPCPIEWFNPNIPADANPNEASNYINQKIEQWKARVSVAIEHWEFQKRKIGII